MKREITVKLVRSDCEKESIIHYPIIGSYAFFNTILDNGWCIVSVVYEDLDITDEFTNGLWLNRLGVK